jgi:hypothetical protein
VAVFNCPQCGHAQAVDDKHIGRTATCPKCKTQGVVQAITAETIIPPASEKEPTTRHAQQKKTNRPFANENSALLMEWIVVDDPRLPVGFSEVCGVMPSIDARRMLDMGGGEYLHYTGMLAFQVNLCAVQAFEVRLMLFNVWGSHVGTLSASEVRDLQVGSRHKDDYSWQLWSYNEGNEHHASIAYVARVRTAEGRVLNADTDFVLREAQRFSEKCTVEDLEPKAPKKE